jgi:endoglucanase
MKNISKLLFGLLTSVIYAQIEPKFSVHNGTITMYSEPIVLRGISWYGFEMNNLVVEGLWKYPMDFYLDIVTNLSFNALRIPFSVDMMYHHNSTVPDQKLVEADPSLWNRTSLDILHILVQKCRERGLLVLLDCHRVSMRQPTPSWYIPDNRYFTEDVFINMWTDTIQEFSSYPHFLGIEIYNEPHGNTTMDDFLYIIQKLFNRVQNPSFLFFIDGVEWGHDFRRLQNDNPLLKYSSQIVYAPHIYGPTLTSITDYSPEYIQYLYTEYFGFLQDMYNASICIAEWGYNDFSPNDVKWATLFIDYLSSHNIRNNFFWSLNPNGRDIKGLLRSDWSTVIQSKLELIQRLCPFPTRFTF